VKFHVKLAGHQTEKGAGTIEDHDRLEKVWTGKHRAPDAHHRARRLDNAMTPFECDLCVFRKLTGRSHPSLAKSYDKLLSAAIRRVLLDALWSRATSTVETNADRLSLGIRLSRMVGLDGPYVHQGPYPPYDHCGYEVAVQMVLYSRREGKNAADHLQFDTMRKLRATYGNQVRASPQGTAYGLSMGNSKGEYQRLNNDTCSSLWFSRFIRGCQIRMGQEWKPNRALSTELIVKLLEAVDQAILEAASTGEMHKWIAFHSYFSCAYAVSLRGTEGLLLDLAGLRRHWESGMGKFVVITLLGKVKGETSDRAHLLPCVEVTSSKLRMRASLERLIFAKERRGFIDGPAISDENGKALSTRDIDDLMHEILVEIFQEHPHLFPTDVNSAEKIQEAYHAFRSPRRSSDTRALEKGVSEDDINIVNRWHTVEAARGGRPSRAMRFHYAQFELLQSPFLRYTGAM
jgi:hypothetical protein